MKNLGNLIFFKLKMAISVKNDREVRLADLDWGLCNLRGSIINLRIQQKFWNSIKRNLMLSPRGAYVTLLKSKRNPSVEQSRQAYLGQHNKQKSKFLKKSDNPPGVKYRSNPKSDRQRISFLNRQSTTRLETKTARRQSKLKSTMNSWSKACISLNTKVPSSH